VDASQGKRLVFVTNNSTKSRAGYLGKFTGLGLNVNAVSRQQQQQQQQQQKQQLQ
jgi:ribonucleotide monophosphatase NagD (HAD superfamily)